MPTQDLELNYWVNYIRHMLKMSDEIDIFSQLWEPVKVPNNHHLTTSTFIENLWRYLGLFLYKILSHQEKIPIAVER